MLEWLQTILVEYPVIAPLLFVIARMMPLIIPPIPGLLVDIVGIAVFGWFYGLILAGTAVVLSSMISFWIARKFREPLLGKFIPLKKLHEWEEKFSEKEKFWALIGLRFISAPFFDTINYAAGLTKIKAWTYFWSTIIVAAPLGFMIYYFGEIILDTPTIIAISIVFLLFFVIGIRKKTGNDPDLV